MDIPFMTLISSIFQAQQVHPLAVRFVNSFHVTLQMQPIDMCIKAFTSTSLYRREENNI